MVYKYTVNPRSWAQTGLGYTSEPHVQIKKGEKKSSIRMSRSENAESPQAENTALEEEVKQNLELA